MDISTLHSELVSVQCMDRDTFKKSGNSERSITKVSGQNKQNDPKKCKGSGINSSFCQKGPEGSAVKYLRMTSRPNNFQETRLFKAKTTN